MRKFILIILILCFYSIPAFAQQNGQTHFRFGAVVDDTTFTGRFQKRVLTEAFRRNGLTLEIVQDIDKTEIADMVDKGLLDGDSQRVGNFAQIGNHQGYVRINVPTFSLEVSAYARKGYRAESWGDIGRLNVPIGYNAAIEIVDQHLQDNVPPDLLTAYPSRLDGMRALRDGKIEIFVISNQYHAQDILQRDEFRDSQIRQITSLIKADMYAYFSKKHANLAPKIAETLHQMQHEGVMKKVLIEIMMK